MFPARGFELTATADLWFDTTRVRGQPHCYKVSVALKLNYNETPIPPNSRFNNSRNRVFELRWFDPIGSYW
jgi:hypothetical protein